MSDGTGANFWHSEFVEAQARCKRLEVSVEYYLHCLDCFDPGDNMIEQALQNLRDKYAALSDTAQQETGDG